MSSHDPDPISGEVDPFAWDDTELEQESAGGAGPDGPEVKELQPSLDQFRLQFAPEAMQVVRGCMVEEVRIHGA